jgi:rhamnogalacturonan endolyase
MRAVRTSMCALAPVLLLACSNQRIDAVTPSGKACLAATGHFQMEGLGRGVVAVKVDTGVFVSWRMMGCEYDPVAPAGVWYNLYRDGAQIASVLDSTNYLDPDGAIGAVYSVRAVVAGAEGPESSRAQVWGENYLRVPVDAPPPGKTPGSPVCENADESYVYDANDGSVGDLDGDGEYDLVLKWQPQNAKDNSQSGCTGNVYLDGYKLDGGKLWRIDLGPNIRAGAHYTQFLVYDLDGDGKAEVALKTAPGTRDGTGAFLHLGPAAVDDDSADYRSVGNAPGTTGYVLTGPEYLTVFAGETGAELATVSFDVPRGEVAAWGDDYGNRVDLYLASVGFVSDGPLGLASGQPSLLMGRGYANRTTMTAWTFRAGQLVETWRLDSAGEASSIYEGQGAHSMAVADVDGDGAQDILFGAATLGSDGKARCSTNLGHGDALHVGDLLPSRPGLEVFMPHESRSAPVFDVRDARTCQVIAAGPVQDSNTTRGVADDVSPQWDGAEAWTNDSGGVASATTGALVDSKTTPSLNFLIYWDGDESRELEDGTTITKYGGQVLQTCPACAANNGSKATPVLTADLFGDWREEIVWRETDNSALRIYTTTNLTMRRLFTLMHDPQYRMQVSSEQTGFNQPPHPSFHIGSGMVDPPRPDMFAR